MKLKNVIKAVAMAVVVTVGSLTANAASIKCDEAYIPNDVIQMNNVKVETSTDSKTTNITVKMTSGVDLDSDLVSKDSVYKVNSVEKEENSNNGDFNMTLVNNNATAPDVQEEFTNMGNKLDSVDKSAKKGIAGAVALAALHPLDYDPSNKLDFAVGYGHYKNENAVAVGAYYRPNENIMISVGGTMGNGDNAVNAGVSFKIGHSGKRLSRGAMENQLKAQQEKIEELETMIKNIALAKDLV